MARLSETLSIQDVRKEGILMKRLPPEIIQRLRYFLDEDIRSGDITTDTLIPEEVEGLGVIYSKSKTIIAGIAEIEAIADLAGLSYEVVVEDGDLVKPGDEIIRLRGKAKTLLQIERVCLNIIQRMSGIATKAFHMVQAAKKENPNVRVAATRKTTPGFRYFEKRAVGVAGADTHRYALDDMVLIKNNHIAIVGSVGKAVRIAKSKVSFSKRISCETRTLSETIEAIEAGADIILLDNMSPKEVAEVSKVLIENGLRKRVILEASGGIDDHNIGEYARSGVDVISSGALTHSYNSADLSMRIEIE